MYHATRQAPFQRWNRPLDFPSDDSGFNFTLCTAVCQRWGKEKILYHDNRYLVVSTLNTFYISLWVDKNMHARKGALFHVWQVRRVLLSMKRPNAFFYPKCPSNRIFDVLLGKDFHWVSGRGQNGRHSDLSRHLGRQRQSCLHGRGQCGTIFPACPSCDHAVFIHLPEAQKQTSSKIFLRAPFFLLSLFLLIALASPNYVEFYGLPDNKVLL